MKAERLCLDRISTLPLPLIENILYRVPFKDAVRTSILSRNWRYNWVTIPKLEFIEDDFEADETFIITTDEDELIDLEWASDSPSERRKQISKRCKLFDAIKQVLLVHRGPIHDFTLSMNADYHCDQIDDIILRLSKNNTLKKFTLKLEPWGEYYIPSSIFSLHQLTDLCLSNCIFEFDPTKFNGFGSLTSLYMEYVYLKVDALLHLISNSPLLKSLTLIISDEIFSDKGFGIYELFECLLVIEHLTISHLIIMCFAVDKVPRELPTSLVHLKSFCLKEMCFFDEYGLPYLLMMMRCSPNLEIIKLQNDGFINYRERKRNFVLLKDVSDIVLDHLKELEIENYSNMKEEMEFVKVILAKSPVLKKVSIYHNVAIHEEVRMLKSLLRSPRASPVVDIIVE